MWNPLKATSSSEQMGHGPSSALGVAAVGSGLGQELGRHSQEGPERLQGAPPCRGLESPLPEGAPGLDCWSTGRSPAPQPCDTHCHVPPFLPPKDPPRKGIWGLPPRPSSRSLTGHLQRGRGDGALPLLPQEGML